MSLVWGSSRGFSRSSRSAAERLLVASILVVGATPAWAQSTPSPVLPPTREEVTRPPAPPPPPATPRLEVEGGVERAPCALDSPEFRDIRLTVRGVEFEGLKGLSPAELGSAFTPFVGQDQPISVVCEIRDRAATILRNAGYIAAVQVPEQRIADGVIHFRVLMAHLTQVRVRGDASGAEQVIAGYLGQLTKQPVFNRYEAERYLLLASDLPGYTVRLTLRPAGGAPGDVIGDVTVQHMPAYVDFNVENGGSQELGPWGGLLRAQLFGLTGLGDRTTLSVFSTSDFHEQQTLQLGHDFHVGPEGLSIAGTFTYAWARPRIPDANVLAKTLLGTIEVGYPFYRRQAKTIRGSVGMDYVNQYVKLDGIPLTRDRLRVAFARFGIDAISTNFSDPRYSVEEPRWRLTTSLELRKGLDIFGATNSCGPAGANCLGPNDVPPSRIEGQPTAVVFRYLAYGEYRPMSKVTFALGARAQYAWKPLLSFEEFSAGNYTVGRGYDPGVLLGDRGFGSQAEIRFGSRIPQSASKPGIEGYGFWDHAVVRNRDRITVITGREHLDSVGGGARISFDRFALDAALAFPLTRAGFDNRRPDPHVLVSLTTRLWPWSYR
ncbi:MAG: ShlB/FhaC/HecB family hemolysin secretion/activation protein [Sphingomicrobium sp.]